MGKKSETRGGSSDIPVENLKSDSETSDDPVAVIVGFLALLTALTGIVMRLLGKYPDDTAEKPKSESNNSSNSIVVVVALLTGAAALGVTCVFILLLLVLNLIIPDPVPVIDELILLLSGGGSGSGSVVAVMKALDATK